MKNSMGRIVAKWVFLVFVSGIGAQAQVGDPATLIKEKLASEIKLTKVTSAHDDIVTAGDVVVLHKDGLVMCSSASNYPALNDYKDGNLKPNPKNRVTDAGKGTAETVFGKLNPFQHGSGKITDAVNNGCTERKFVSGEKFWVTDIGIEKNGILVSTFSDPYDNVRYFGQILFLLPKKGPVPPVDEFLKTVAEVMTVQPADDSGKGGETGQATQAQAQTQAPSVPPTAPMQPITPPPAPESDPMPTIPPPPPPADQPPPPPKTITDGQTIDQVGAI